MGAVAAAAAAICQCFIVFSCQSPANQSRPEGQTTDEVTDVEHKVICKERKKEKRKTNPNPKTKPLPLTLNPEPSPKVSENISKG